MSTNVFLFVAYLSYDSGFFVGSDSTLECSVSTSFLTVVSSVIGSLLDILPRFGILMSSGPGVPLSLCTFLRLELTRSVHLVPVVLASGPTSSGVTLRIFPFSCSTVGYGLGSLMWIVPLTIAFFACLFLSGSGVSYSMGVFLLVLWSPLDWCYAGGSPV